MFFLLCAFRRKDTLLLNWKQRRQLKEYAAILRDSDDERVRWVGDQLIDIVEATPQPRKIPLRSTRQKTLNAQRSKMLELAIAEHGNICEVGRYLAAKGVSVECASVPHGLHEPHKRVHMGGSARSRYLLDSDLCLLACDKCNGWVEDNPSLAYEYGLACHAWQSIETAKRLVMEVRDELLRVS